MANGSLISFLVAFCFLACDSQLADSPPPSFLRLSMSMDPGKLNVLSDDTLLVNLASIRLWRGAERREWAIISDTNRVYNLFALTDGEAVRISNNEVMFLPPGNYTRLTVRLLAQDTLMVLGGKKYSVRIPQEAYQIVNLDQDIQLVKGETVDIKVIFDAEPSLTFQLGYYRLIPKFRLSPQ